MTGEVGAFMKSGTAIFATILVILADQALAQNVPLPQPAPRNAPGAPPRPSTPIPLDPNAPQNTRPSTARVPAPTIRPAPQVQPGGTTAFDAKQRALVE